MSVENKIQKITVPKITLDEMTMVNLDDPNSPVQSTDLKFNQAGSLFPYVLINNYFVNENELSYFRLDMEGFLPKLSLAFAISDGKFITKYYPKDGDPISIFIRSKMDEFNPIRLDFTIKDLKSIPGRDSDGSVAAFFADCVLRVPKLYVEWCRAFKDKTSMDALLDVATDMQLGFATNETTTNDSMTWLCPFDTYEKFINNVTASSYKDDDSFFTSFIDQYYMLNFVNINSQFSENFEIDYAMDIFDTQTDYFKGDKLDKFDTQVLLCNHKNLIGHGNYIAHYVLRNRTGNVVEGNGYRRFLQFYDMSLDVDPQDKYQNYFIEPLNTNGVQDKILLKGRVKEPDIFEFTNRYKYLGIQTSLPEGGVHDNYKHAQLNNWQNGKEIGKMSLIVSLNKCNFNLYRGQRVPVIILLTGGNERQKMAAESDQSENAQVSVDKFLSGYYYIDGMTIQWDDRTAKFTQEITLCRREWPIPNQSSENIAQG